MIALNDLQRLHAPQIAELRDAVGRVLDSGRFVLGSECSRFEGEFAAWCGTRHAVGVANGTDALEIALRAAGVRPNDTVITVANAGGYATTAILACKATPRYVDVDSATMNLDVRHLANALLPDVRAVVLTHLYGRLGPAADVARLCRAAGVALIEDCAQAHGARDGACGAGAFGDAGCFSFYPTKNLGALGDGGAIVTDDDALDARVRRLRQYGWEAKYHAVEDGGRNSRLDELQAAVLSRKLPRVAAGNARRRAIAQRYATEIDNAALAAHLAREGVQTDVHYPVPDHRQPFLTARFAATTLPVTEALADEILTLPCHPAMTDEEVSHVVAACARFAA